MSKTERLAKKNFQPNAMVECIFGSRIKPVAWLKLDNFYWTVIVKVVQPIIDRINMCHCYLVDDMEKKVIGVAVASSHLDFKTLWVHPKDFVSYDTDEERSKVLADFRTKLGH